MFVCCLTMFYHNVRNGSFYNVKYIEYNIKYNILKICFCVTYFTTC